MALGIGIGLIAALLAGWALWRTPFRAMLSGFMLSPTDVRTLVKGSSTDAGLSQMRRDVGDRAAFENLYAQSEDPWISRPAPGGYQDRKYAGILSFLPPGRRFAAALDIGCGLGELSRRLAPLADTVTGVDLAQGAVERARRDNAGTPNLTFLQGDVFDLPAAMDGQFDLVLLADILYYAPQTSEEAYYHLAGRIARLLRPGGICVVVNHYFLWDEPTRLSRRIYAAFPRAGNFRVLARHWRPFYLTMLLTRPEPGAAPPAPARAPLKRILLTLLGLALIGLIGWNSFVPVAAAVARAGWSLPIIMAIHLTQLFLSALAWRLLMQPNAPTPLGALRMRWIREAVNLLPLAQIGGFLVSVRLAAQRGLNAAAATASTALDTLTEAAAQLIFVLGALLLLVTMGTRTPSLGSIAEGLAAMAAGLLALFVAHRAGWLGRLERGLGRRFPSLRLQGRLDGEIRRLLDDRFRAGLSAGLHLLSWMLGAAEVMMVLWAIGTPVSLSQALVIESLGTAARSLGFAIPGGLGFQEGGFVLACGLFGIGQETAIALSMVKRLREVVIGICGLLLWQRSEIKARTA